ncbi:elongation factor P maturation arginine rhamnosyltransferase EarP [Pseudoalteromonas fenneropenaei]|uniref:Protein-arginine rhamnosyltransferase n=1 Tax=Pseudoalteromonas fenneropenaei TaxID=1737459 RepID=A0ABV7CNN8_9GAMM
MTEQFTWDIFCDVIDNFGDIGVTWRLAKQLAARDLGSVRLWVNDLNSFGAMLPEIVGKQSGYHAGVQIQYWSEDFDSHVIPAKYVIEAFACTLPACYQTQMPTHSLIWLNLEYLSAEDWVEGCHGLPSGLQAVPKFFFFPGFTERTGGVVIEQDYQQRQNAFNEPKFWQRLGIPDRQNDELRVSIFTYENRAWPSLLQVWQQHVGLVRLLVPKGRALTSLLPLFSQQIAADHWVLGNIHLHVIPFTRQEAYDELLWACDFNFIRGEDSFVRAQLAAKPFVWHIYPQDEDAHIEKLSAFFNLFDCPVDAVTQLQLTFNREQDCFTTLTQATNSWSKWQQHCQHWATLQIKSDDLVSRVVKFLNSKI